jgi:hypothetical protein
MKKFCSGFFVGFLLIAIYMQEVRCKRISVGMGKLLPRAQVSSVVSQNVDLVSERLTVIKDVLHEQRAETNKAVVSATEVARVSTTNQPQQVAQRVGAPTEAHASYTNHAHIAGEGVVVVISGDGESGGGSHQRFMVRLKTGRMLLIERDTAHSPRLENLKLGDTVSFSGEYLYDVGGDVVRVTYNDQTAQHIPGWLKHNGVTYQ